MSFVGDIRLKTPSSGILSKVPSRGILGDSANNIFSILKSSKQFIFDKNAGFYGSEAEDRIGANNRAPLEGRCYVFDGTDDYVDVDSLLTQLASDTVGYVSFWLKPTDNDAENAVFSLGNNADATQTEFWIICDFRDGQEDFNQALAVDGVYQWGIETDASSITAGEWVHYLLVQNGTSPVVYLNGSAVNLTFNEDTNKTKWFKSVLTDASTKVDNGDIGTLRRNSTPLAYLNGSLYDLRIGNYVPSASEIADIVAHKPPATTPQAWYKCDEQIGTVSYDSSTNGNHGNIKNATLATFHGTQTADIGISPATFTGYSFQNQEGWTPAGYFNDSSTEVNFGDRSDLEFTTGQAFSVCGWVCPSGDNAGYIITKYDGADGYGLYWSAGDDYLRLANESTGITSDAVFTEESTPVHFGMTVATDGSVLFYRNGVAAGGGSGFTASATGFDVIIGNRGGGAAGATFFSGAIWKLRVWNTKLSAAEVASDYVGTAVQTAGLVMDVPFDPSEGSNVKDLQGSGGVATDLDYVYLPVVSGSTNDVTNATTATYRGRCKLNAKLVDNNCGTFDGTDDEIQIADSSDFTFASAMTLSCWVKPANTSASENFIFQYDGTTGDGYYLTVNVAGEFRFGTVVGGSTETISSDEEPSGEWQHVVGIRKADGTMVMYVNKILQYDTDTNAGEINSSATVYLGSNGASAYFEGSMCAVQMWNADESANIEAIYNGDEVDTDNRVLCIPLAEGAGNAANDHSGNDNHGTITNATLATFWGTTQDVYAHNVREGFTHAAYFAGTDNNITVSADSTIDIKDATSFTAAAWIYANSDGEGNYGRIFNKADLGVAGWLFYIQFEAGSNARLNLDVILSDTVCDAQSVSIPLLKKWYHVACTYNEDGDKKGKIYINGVLQTLADDIAGVGTLSDDSGEDLIIGDNEDSGRAFDGLITLAEYHNIALTATQIAELYAGNRIPANEQLYFDMDDSAAAGTIPDLSQNTNTGTATGATIAKVTSGAIGVVSRPADYWHNYAESNIEQYQVPSLIYASAVDGNDYWFDTASDNDIQTIGYADIVDNVDDDNQIFADISVDYRKKNLLTYNEEQTGSTLSQIQSFLNQ